MAYQDFTHEKYPEIELRLYPAQTRTVSDGYNNYQHIEFPPLIFALVPYPENCRLRGRKMLSVGALKVIDGKCHVAKLPLGGIHGYLVCLGTGRYHFAFKLKNFSAFVQKFWQTSLHTFRWGDFLKWFKAGCSRKEYYFRCEPLETFLAEIRMDPDLSVSQERVNKLANAVEDGLCTRDAYDDPLAVMDLDKVIEALERQVLEWPADWDSTRRSKWALAFLKSVKENTSPAESIKVIGYGN